MDRIQSLRLYLRVVELGSFSKAAAELGIGQPAATKQVARLEQKLGARLLHRSTHGVSPTEIGARYYDKCREIARHLDEAESLAALMQSGLSGSLRITTSVAFGRRVLAPLLMRFMHEHPGLQIDLVVDDRYVDLISQGVDLAVRMGRLSDSNLGARYLGASPWVLAASPGWCASHPGLSHPGEFEGLPQALIYNVVQGDARWRFTGPAGEQVSIPIRGPLRTNSLSVLLAAARDGMGVAALPRYVAEASLRQGTLQPLLPDWTLPTQEVHAVYPSPQLVPQKVSELVTWLQAQFTEGWWGRLAVGLA